jgi:hypothetical protein
LSNWVSFATNSLTFSATTNVIDPNAGSYSNRFYRAVGLP